MKLILGLLFLAANAHAVSLSGGGGGGGADGVGITQAAADDRYLNTPGDTATGQHNFSTVTVKDLIVTYGETVSTLSVTASFTAGSTSTFVGNLEAKSSATASHVQAQSIAATAGATVSSFTSLGAADIAGNTILKASATASHVQAQSGAFTRSLTISTLTVIGSDGAQFSSGPVKLNGDTAIPFQIGESSFVVTSSSFVGIGSTVALGGTRLHVAGSGGNPRIQVTDSVGISRIQMGAYSGSQNGFIGMNSPGGLDIMTNSQSIRMRVSETGQVGIGRTNPEGSLDVVGSAVFRGTVSVQGSSLTVVGADLGVSSGTIFVSGNSSVAFRVGVTTMIVRGSDGYMGLNTSNPSALLHIGSGSDVPVSAGTLLYINNGGTSMITARNDFENEEVSFGMSSARATIDIPTDTPLLWTLNASRRGIFTSGGDIRWKGSITADEIEAKAGAHVHISSGGENQSVTLLLDGNASTSFQIGSSSFVATGGGFIGVGASTGSPRFIVAPPSAQTIAAGGIITADACGTLKNVTAGGAVTTDLVNTITVPSSLNAGCCMDIVNTGTANTITLDQNANNNLAADTALGPCDTIRACSDGTDWYFNAVFAGTCN